MRKKSIGGIALVLALALGIQGCYGSFSLTRKLWQANGQIGNPWVNEVVFLVAVIIPVYDVAALVDAVALNSIEFWTGKNPMLSKVITKGDKTLAIRGDKATGLVYVSAFENGRLTNRMVLKKTDDGIAAVDPLNTNDVIALATPLSGSHVAWTPAFSSVAVQ